jgi:cobalamin synthase
MLPFTIDTFFATINQYNQAVWPFPLAGFPLAMIAIGCAMAPVINGARILGAVLVVAWLWSGIGFHLLHFSTINFAAPAYAGVFTL